MRSVDEIRADLALAEPLSGMASPQEWAEWAAARYRLATDVGPLLARVEAVEAEDRRIVDHASRLGSPDGAA